MQVWQNCYPFETHPWNFAQKLRRSLNASILFFGKVFVNILATMLSGHTYLNFTSPFSSNSVSELYFTGICFVFPCYSVFCTIYIAKVLSHMMVVAHPCSSPKSFTSFDLLQPRMQCTLPQMCFKQWCPFSWPTSKLQ